MKKQYSLGFFYIVFSILFILGLLVFFPVERKISELLQRGSEFVAEKIYYKTELTLTYESVSYSLLSRIYLKNVDFVDDDGQKVLSVKTASLRYNILDLLKGDFQNGITSAVFDGITLDVEKGIHVIEHWKTTPKKLHITVEDIKRALPYKITLKNIRLDYEINEIDFSAALKKITLHKDFNNNDFGIDCTSNLNLFIKKAGKLKNENISCEFGVNGNVDYNFEKAHLFTSFSNISFGSYKLNKLNLLATYENKNLEIKTVQSVIPLFISLGYINEEQKLSLELKTDHLKPLTVISTKANQKKLMKYSDIVLTSDTHFSYSLEGKNMDYDSSGNIYIPEKVFSGGVSVVYGVKGDEKQVTVNRFTADGPDCSAEISGSYMFDKMQVTGIAEIPFIKLPNETVVSTELYFEPLENEAYGTRVVSPQIFIGEKALTAMQLMFAPQKKTNTYDFVLDVSDYSRLDQDEPGNISVNGSFLPESKYFQTNVGFDSLYLDSIFEFVAMFTKESMAEKIMKNKEKLKPYIFSGDAYVSSDLKSLSFNIPYIILANTQADNQYLMLSLNGNNDNLQLNRASLVYNKYAVEASGSLEKTGYKNDLFFTFDMNPGSVPYHFAGSSTDNFITITGDYDLSLSLDMRKFQKKKEMEGSLYFKNLPIMLSSASVILTGDSTFGYDPENGPVLTVNTFETEVNIDSLDISPKLAASGSVTKYGAQLNTFTYQDSYSLLDGTADVTLNINENLFDSAGLLLNLKNPSSEESVLVDLTCTNPGGEKLTLDTIKDSLYFTSQLRLNRINLNRIAKLNHENNQLTTSLYATGTLNHPSVIMNIDELCILLASDFLYGHGIALLEDRNITVEEFNIDFSALKIDRVKAEASLDTMTAHAEGTLNLEIAQEEAHIPLTADILDTVVKPGKLIPDSFRAEFAVKDTYGGLLKKPIDISLSGIWVNDVFTIFSEKNFAYGTLTKKGELNVKIDSENLIKMNIGGAFNMNSVALKFTDTEINLENLFSYINLDKNLKIYSGILDGYVNLTGSFVQPVLKGAIKISDPSLMLPNFCPDRISGTTMLVTVDKDEIKLVENVYSVKNKKKLNFKASVYLNKWKLDHIEARLSTLNNENVYGGMNTSVFNVWGNINFVLDLFYENNILDCKGDFFGENVVFTAGINSLTSNRSDKKIGKEKKLKVTANLGINLGNHASFNFDPILRCILTPNSKVSINVDQQTDSYQLSGNVNIKSGDIAYLNRNFYIKEGTVKLNPEQFSNPMISIVAETREKDDAGEKVRIILTANNQYLLDFYPRFTSIPAKSESEIRALLGQIVIADSNENVSGLLFAAGDYVIQSAIVRKAENKLRDFMKFDIFSLRTNIIQNTLSMGITGDIANGKLSLGSVLDNSTLYIGKYLGSAIYVDAMLHVSFEDKYTNSFTSGGNIIFQPEIGFELDSPFGNIRWNMTPDINALLKNQFVPTSSVTLSWKWAF